MKKLNLKPLESSYLSAIAELQTAYSAIYSDAPVISGEVYLSPAFENGQNLICAIDENGKLVGYAPLYPVLMRDASNLPHTLWTEIKVHPNEEAPNEIKDRLLEQIVIRAREVTDGFPGHPIHLTFQYFPSETASIEYVQFKGCKHTESVFTMRRDLAQVVPNPVSVKGVRLHPWKMESEAEQRMYVQM